MSLTFIFDNTPAEVVVAMVTVVKPDGVKSLCTFTVPLLTMMS